MGEALAAVRVAAFSMRLQTIGRFPGRSDTRVLWSGVDPEEPVRRLAAAIDDRLEAAGVARDEKPFSPHITLARLRRPVRPAIDSFVADHAAFASPEFAVGQFVLFSSVLSPSGAMHRIEERYALTEEN